MNKLRRPETLVLLVVAPLLLVGLLGHEGYKLVAWVPVFVVTSALIIPLHEAGHGLLGATVGLRIARIVVGKGRVILQRRIGGAMWDWCLIPLGGMIIAAPFDGSRFLRARMWLFVLGGPLVDAAIAWLAWRLSVRFQAHDLLGSILTTVTWTAGTQLFFDLLPIKGNASGVKVGSDGRQLLSIPFLKPDEVKTLYASHYAVAGADEGQAENDAGALAWFEKGLARYPDDPTLRQMRAYSLHKLGRDDEALAETSSQLALGETPIRPMLLNNWSWYAFHRGDDRDLRLADRRSAEAVSLLPDLAATAGTRGAVLLWQGRVNEALPLLHRAYDGAPSKNSRASDGCLLAKAYAAIGNKPKAQKYLQAARAANPNSDLLPGADAAVVAMAPGPRCLNAARGSRAVVIYDDELELIGAGRLTPVRISFEDIKTAAVSLTARGAGQLVIEYGSGRWRMPLERGTLGAARIALHKLLGQQTAPPVPVAEQQAIHRQLLRPAGQLVGVAASLALLVGKLQADPSFADILTWALANVPTFAPGPGPLLGLGTAMMVQLMVDFSTGTGADSQGSGSTWFWSVALAVIAVMALAIGWSGRKTGPEGRKQGVRVTVGILIVLMLPGAMALVATILRGLTVHRLNNEASELTSFSVGSIALAVVLLAVGRPRFRVPAAVIGAVGVAFLVVCSGPYYEAVVLSRLGPKPTALVWTSRPAAIVRQAEIPDGVSSISVSPSGLAWVASAPKPGNAGAEVDEGDKDDYDSPVRARAATLLLGDFAGQVHTVPGFAAGFIDDQRLLILAHPKEDWQVRELVVSNPGEATRVAAIPVSKRPILYRDEPSGTMHIQGPYDGESLEPRQHWIWSSEQGLQPPSEVVQRQIGIFDDGRLVSAGFHLLRCPGWQTPGRLFCIVASVHPVQLLSLDAGTGAHQRVASIPSGRSINVLSGGRIAVVVHQHMTVIDPTAHTATRLLLDDKSTEYTRWLVPTNLAMATRRRVNDKFRMGLTVFASP
ncbi:MAG TPA: site-2 protease family protein [Polyangia bacterium]|jgi:tetratricopeptide (TPR) repeat protein|nr:site-2 protease family protein [Polyangia bacterium]